MNKKYIVILAAIFFICMAINGAKAQVKNSVYSMFGVGRVNEESFGVNRAMGGTGIAFRSGISMNYLNPASYLGIPQGSINLEFGVFGIYSGARNKNISQYARDINVSYMSASFYLTNMWAFCFGVAPFSSIDYEINSTDEIGGELTLFDKRFTGSGGLSRAFMGHSFQIYKGLSVGFNTSYIFGPITQTEIALSNNSFSGYELENRRFVHGLYLDYGLQYSIGFRDWRYTVGLVYGPEKKLHSIDDLEFTYNGTTTALTQDDDLNISIPKKYGAGFSIQKNNNLRAGFDYEWKKWSYLKFLNPNLDAKNSKRFSFGLEYSPQKRGSIFNRAFYRFGANYKNSYIEIDNTQINSVGLSLGIGIPQYYKLNNFNFSVEYGEEGTMNNGLIKNNYFMLYSSFSLHEFWARR